MPPRHRGTEPQRLPATGWHFSLFALANVLQLVELNVPTHISLAELFCPEQNEDDRAGARGDRPLARAGSRRVGKAG